MATHLSRVALVFEFGANATVALRAAQEYRRNSTGNGRIFLILAPEFDNLLPFHWLSFFIGRAQESGILSVVGAEVSCRVGVVKPKYKTGPQA
jgi:hypothetical protein